MASLYSEAHRALQEEFGTTKLAVRLDEDWVHETVQPEEAAFIGSRDMFFLSTVDPDGMPTETFRGIGRNDRLEYQGTVDVTQAVFATFGAEREVSRFSTSPR